MAVCHTRCSRGDTRPTVVVLYKVYGESTHTVDAMQVDCAEFQVSRSRPKSPTLHLPCGDLQSAA